MNLISSDGSILISSTDCVTDLKAKPGGNVLNTGASPSFLFSGNGSTLPLVGYVKLSQYSGNTIVLNPDGLYVAIPTITETLLTAVSTPTVRLTLSGLSAHTLRADVNISTQAGNAITVTGTGLYVASSTGGAYTDAQARNAISAAFPIVYNSVTGLIGINLATASSAGYLSSGDWTKFNSKEPGVPLGTTAQYYRGDKTWQLLNTTVVTEGTNQYFTAIRARNSVSAIGPVTYNAVTGVFGIVLATVSSDGYLSSSDWNTFGTKVGNGVSLASVNAQSIYKDKNSSNILEFRGIRAGLGVTLALVSDDIVINAAGTIPVANAGADQGVVLPTTTVTLSGSATTSSGTIVATTWSLLSGPIAFNITNAASLNTTVTGLVAGTYTFRLTVVNSFGLVGTDDMSVTVSGSVGTLDTIYVGASSVGTTPSSANILAGISSLQNGALNVSADWTTFNGTPQFLFFAIPDTDSAHEKNKWFVDSLNNGNIGTPSDTFGALAVVVVGGVNYSVGITNFATQFVSVVQLQKV